MRNINEVKNCYGCFACMSKCPKQCISIEKDKLGHLYPLASIECIECNACLKVCPSINTIKLNKPIDVYAAVGKNSKIIEKSSSGGIATILSREIISSGGVVYGCAFQKNFHFKHIRCDNIEDLENLKGSKYVQSDISEVYFSIKNDLKHNKKVLFIGTPCQTAAIKIYFNDNTLLYTVDLICHGVPSLDILKISIPPYINKAKIDSIKFRTKEKYQLALFENSRLLYTRPLSKDFYLKGFFTSLFNRESCFSCQYTTKNRIGDITLGDFWGLNDFNLKNNKGISLCIINTDKGKTLYSAINKNIFSTRHNIDEALKGNKPLNHPSSKTLNVKLFRLLYPVLGFKFSVLFSIPGIVIKNIIRSIK